MSEKYGPLFKPQNEGFFVFTNIGAHPKFTDSDKSNNTVQLTGDVWEGLRMAQQIVATNNAVLHRCFS